MAIGSAAASWQAQQKAFIARLDGLEKTVGDQQHMKQQQQGETDSLFDKLEQQVNRQLQAVRAEMAEQAESQAASCTQIAQRLSEAEEGLAERAAAGAADCGGGAAAARDETLTVTCPDGVGPGETVVVEAADGQVTVVVPDGVRPGETFEITVDPLVGLEETAEAVSAGGGAAGGAITVIEGRLDDTSARLSLAEEKCAELAEELAAAVESAAGVAGRSAGCDGRLGELEERLEEEVRSSSVDAAKLVARITTQFKDLRAEMERGLQAAAVAGASEVVGIKTEQNDALAALQGKVEGNVTAIAQLFGQCDANAGMIAEIDARDASPVARRAPKRPAHSNRESLIAELPDKVDGAESEGADTKMLCDESAAMQASLQPFGAAVVALQEKIEAMEAGAGALPPLGAAVVALQEKIEAMEAGAETLYSSTLPSSGGAGAAPPASPSTGSPVGRPLTARPGRTSSSVRDPTTWTILQNDGPNHLGLW